MEQNFVNRGYLLPAGCKDLIDVLNLEGVQASPQHSVEILKLSPEELDQWFKAVKQFELQPKKFKSGKPFPEPAAALPPIVGQIVVPAETAVVRLAALLGRDPFQIIADVMALGFFMTPEDSLSFSVISSVARKHGFLAIRAAA